MYIYLCTFKKIVQLRPCFQMISDLCHSIMILNDICYSYVLFLKILSQNRDKDKISADKIYTKAVFIIYKLRSSLKLRYKKSCVQSLTFCGFGKQFTFWYWNHV